MSQTGLSKAGNGPIKQNRSVVRFSFKDVGESSQPCNVG